MQTDSGNWNKQVVTFCAVAVLFVGALFYMVSFAFKSGRALQAREVGTIDLTQGI